MTGAFSRTMDISCWDGTLTRNEFYLGAQAFTDKWQSLDSASPLWSWVAPPRRQPLLPSASKDQLADGYLSLERILPDTSEKDDEPILDREEVDGFSAREDGFSAREEGFDDATLLWNDHVEVHYYDFHVVYSDSFRVPVLYFRGYCSDGRPLLLGEIERDLPAGSTKELLESKWSFITQEEHPYLNRPWYKLHPCGTAEWMKLLFLGNAASAEGGVSIERYLVSWLSVVGQVVGIRIPMELVNDGNPTDG